MAWERMGGRGTLGIKIHPFSPAALRILIAGPLAEDSVEGPLHANRGRTCRMFYSKMALLQTG